MFTFPLLAESYLHRLDPFAIQFTETIGIRWYGLAYLVGFLAAWMIMRWLSRTGRCRLTVDQISDYVFFIVIGVLVGGRLGYCIFYQPSLFIDPPLIGVIMIWKGGMASHGGFVGVVVATWFFARKHRLSTLHVLDMGALSSPVGLGLGRLANFVNAELWGRALPASLQAQPPWWSIKYPEEIMSATFQHGNELASLRPLLEEPGGAPRFVREDLMHAMQDGHAQVTEAIRPLLTAYYPSQIFQALTDGPILIAAMAALWWFRLKPGCVGGGFLITYGVMRIATEAFRQPDTGVTLLPTPFGDLSRGQVLSVLMVAAGIALAAISAWRKSEPMGCLRKPAPAAVDAEGGSREP